MEVESSRGLSVQAYRGRAFPAAPGPVRPFFPPQRVSDPFALIQLPPLMRLTAGRPNIRIGLIDGPVVFGHPRVQHSNIHSLGSGESCADSTSYACTHGTMAAAVLCGRRAPPPPGICPECTLLVRPIFPETAGAVPSATPEQLARAIIDCVSAGARLINLSLALAAPRSCEPELHDALGVAAARGVIVVAAAGNYSSVGSAVLGGHPWVIPVISYDLNGIAMGLSNIGRSIGTRGLGGPGEGIRASVPNASFVFGGTSAATAFVTGAIALLWSMFPEASASGIRRAAIRGSGSGRGAIVPPLMNAWAAYKMLARGERI